MIIEKDEENENEDSQLQIISGDEAETKEERKIEHQIAESAEADKKKKKKKDKKKEKEKRKKIDDNCNEQQLGEGSINKLILEEAKHYDDIDKSDVQFVGAKTKTKKKYLPDTRESLNEPKQVLPKKD